MINNQYELFTGEKLRDAGVAQVISHNEEYAAQFTRAAGDILEEHGSVTSDEVVQRIGMPIGHPNAVGAAMRGFGISMGLKVRGYRKSTRPSCHAAIVGIWSK